MFHRTCLSALLVAGVALAVSGCTTSNTSVSSITVSPAAQSVAVGQTAQFTASGTVDHGSHPPTTQDETSAVTWSSSAPAIATVNSDGLATAVSAGTATITATVPGGGVTPSTGTITVTASIGGSTGGDVTSISVLPGTQSVAALGDTTQFIATGTTSSGATENVSNQVSWSSSSVQVATINTSGLATAVGPGTATITAILTNADKTVATGTASFTITASGGTNGVDVTSISVIPGTQSDSLGDQTQFIAIGTTSSGATENVGNQVSWSSSNDQVATILATGFATAVGPGTATITALLTNADKTVATGTASLTVTAPTGGSAGGDVTSLSVIPGTQSVASANDITQFLAIGTTSSGVTENVSGLVTWSSSSTNIVTINSSTGFATAANPGTATITALFTNPDKTVATGTSTFTVQGPIAEEVTALAITPTQQSLSASGQTGQFIALGTSGTTGLQLNVTSATGISWSSSAPTVASVSATGLVTGASPGQTTITAIFTNPDGTASSASGVVNVTSSPAPEPLQSLTIIPSTITVGNLQDTGNFLAIGTFSTPPTVRDLTNSVTWISSAPNIFPVDTNSGTANPAAPGGLVTAYGNGSGTIIAEAVDPTTGSIQTATATFSCPLVLPNPPNVAGSCYTGSQAPSLLATLTVYNEGGNTTNWLVTASSATGTQDVIHCGPGWTGSGGQVCVATYPVGTTVTLTATQPAGSTGTFGGWSDNCTTISPNPATADGPNTCTIVPNQPPYTDANPAPTNITVGAIFN